MIVLIVWQNVTLMRGNTVMQEAQHCSIRSTAAVHHMFVCDTIASWVNDNLKQTCNSIQTASPPCGLYLAACFLNMYIGGLFSNCITFKIQTSTMMWTNPSPSILYVYIRSWWEDGLCMHYSESPSSISLTRYTWMLAFWHPGLSWVPLQTLGPFSPQ